MNQPVTVTGMGIVCSIGKNIAEYRNSLKKGECGIGFLKRVSTPAISMSLGAEIADYSFESMLRQYDSLPQEIIGRAKQAARRSPFVIQVSIMPVLEAWERAQLHTKPIRSERLGIVIAGNNLTQHYQYDLFSKFQHTPEYLTPTYPLHSMDTDHVGTLSEVFAIHGEGFSVGGASASGNVAILKGCQLIRLGVVDACLVVGAVADLSPMELQGFHNIGAMGGKCFQDDPERACRPFDKEHEGFIYGQASGCVVLESVESTQRRGVRVLAEVLGGSLVLDGRRLPDPCEEGEVRAMEWAIGQAEVETGDVDYLNAHGTSSPLGDDTEIRAVKKVFKEGISRLWINSTKGLTGHCLFSAGVIECIATIIQMLEGFVHPNRNLDNPIDNECRFSPEASVRTPIDISMSNSFGFGGINTSLILKKGDEHDGGGY